jgi:hypothetical protein
MLTIKKKVKGYRPLCYINKGLLLAKNKKIYVCDLELNNIKFMCKIPTTLREVLFSKSRLISRIFRLHIRYALNVKNKYVFLVYGSQIWRVDLSNFKITLDFCIPKNRTALYLTHIEGRVEQYDKVVFGEYFNNPGKKSVNIWSTFVDKKSNWHVINKFAPNEINHIHNIICDEDNNDCYIFTGDFGNGAAIWKSNKNLDFLDVFLRGDQAYRSCWAIIKSGKLSYATDTPLELNNFCHIIGEEVEKVQITEGSSIYFGKNINNYYFSTTIEPDESSGNFIRDIFSYKLGKGILSNRSKIYSVSSDGCVEFEFKAEKDILPTRLAQFGSFTFPSGLRRDEMIIAYGVALKGCENYCLLLKQEDPVQ